LQQQHYFILQRLAGGRQGRSLSRRERIRGYPRLNGGNIRVKPNNETLPAQQPPLLLMLNGPPTGGNDLMGLKAQPMEQLASTAGKNATHE
jgi:hypothetical protein